jgi:hypothetical protein
MLNASRAADAAAAAMRCMGVVLFVVLTVPLNLASNS